MTKKLVDIDETTLAQAREILGAQTMKETVNRALQEVVALDRRRAHVQRLVTMEGLDLDDGSTMLEAWH